MTFNRYRIIGAIGQRLRKLREQLNYSQSQMAGLMGLSESGYLKNEHGTRLPGLAVLDRIQGEWDISMDWFLFNKGPMYFPEKSPDPEPSASKTGEFPSSPPLSPELVHLLEYMDRDPLLKHEILVYFYKYKESKAHQAAPVVPGTD